MKSKIISGAVAALALLTGMTAALAASGGGDGKVGNGGDGCAAEFAAIGLNLARMLPDLGVRDVNQDEFQKTVEKTPVVVTEKDLFVQGKKVQAINDPDKKLITINKSLCDPLATPPASKVMVVFHEYLGIMRLEKSGEYRISSSISNLLTDGTLELLTSGTKKPRNFRVDGVCIPVEDVIRNENIAADNGSAEHLLRYYKHGAYIRNIAHNDLDADYIFVEGSMDTCKMAVEIIRKKFRKQVVEKLMRDFASGDSNASFRAQSTLQVVGGNLDKRWISYSPNTTYFLWATNIWLVSHAAEWGNPGLMKLIVDANWHEPRTDWSKPADINNGQYDNSLYSAVRRAAWEFQKFGASKKYLQYLQVMQILLRAGHVPNDPAIVSSISNYKQQNFCGQSTFWDMLTSPGNPYQAQKMAAYGSSCGVCGGNADALKTHFASMISRMPAPERLAVLSSMMKNATTSAEKSCIRNLGWGDSRANAYIALVDSSRNYTDNDKYIDFSRTVQKAHDGGNWNDAIDWNGIIDPNGGGVAHRLPTPLMYAVWKGDIFLVRLMLTQKNGNLHQKHMFKLCPGSDGYYCTRYDNETSLLDVALTRGKLDIAKMLVTAGFGLKDFSHIEDMIAYDTNIEVFKYLMELGYDPNDFVNGSSLLLRAITLGKEEKAIILLDYGADPKVGIKPEPGAESKPHEKMYPIHLAVFKKMYRLVEKLVQKGEAADRLQKIPDTNWDSCVQTNGFYTPLMYAAQAGDLEMTKLLIKLGANTNARYSGVSCNCLDYNCREKKYTHNSLSAADLAERNKHFVVAKFLRKHMLQQR